MVKWMRPIRCRPPHGVTHLEKFDELVRDFTLRGWDTSKPVLVGYWFEGKFQLISGSHRWAAALFCQMRIPVRIVSYAEVYEAWGNLETWETLLNGGE